MFGDRYMDAVPRGAVFGAASALVVLTGLADYYTGREVSFSIFYLLPVALMSWRGTLGFGLAVATFAGVVWLVSDLKSGHPYSHAAIPYWNAFVRFMFFIIVSALLAKTKEELRKTLRLASTDPLTGLHNSRAFYEKVASETDRSRRYKHVFSIAYMDLDNFKAVNDVHGHAAGDDLLKHVATVIRDSIRQTDLAARLGGDEFAVMFIEVTPEGPADVVNTVRSRILTKMKADALPTTMSIGMVTYEDVPRDAKEIIGLADRLMYSVKASGKNNVMHKTWRDGALRDA